MKTKFKLLTMLFILAEVLLNKSTIMAQSCFYSGSVPIRTEILSYPYLDFTNGVTNGCGAAGTFNLRGVGANMTTPAYMLDILCDPTTTPVGTNKDVNISCPNCTPANSVGYRIGGNYVLWHDGDVSSIFVGVNAGNTSGLGLQNTFVGGNAGSSVTTNGNANVAVGYYSLTANTSGNHNTALGDHALYSNIASNNNTAVGGNALQNGTGSNNTAVGYDALISSGTGTDNVAMGYNALYYGTGNSFNTAVGEGSLLNNTQDYNTALGYYSLYNNTTGFGNTGTGSFALDDNQTGNNNTATGYEALLNNLANNNTAMGYASLLKNVVGTLNTAVGVVTMYNNLGYSGNTAVGDSALYSETGSGTIPSDGGNVAVGNSVLFNGTNNLNNVAVGQWAMRHGGDNCVGIGFGSLYSGGGVNNTATGYECMYSMATGTENTAYGYQALYSSAHNGDNVAVGEYALFYNVANYNTAVGTTALQGNTVGTSNTAIGGNSLGGSTASSNSAIGMWAGMNNAGDMNTFLGDSAGYACNLNTMNNDVFLGFQSGPNVLPPFSSNTVYLGNNSTGSIEATSIMTITSWSDRRIKDSIKANVPGLAFINKIQPVTFHYDIGKEDNLMGIQDTTNWPGKYDVEKITQSGFIAQNVDSAAQACGYNFSGVIRPQSANEPYKVGYTTFVVPLVKAVQELSAKNDTLHDSLRSMRTTLDSVRTVLQSIQICLNQLCGTSGGQGVTGPQNGGPNSNATKSQDITLSGAIGGAPLLYQNTPNPFGTGGTKINYYLPEGTMGASIIFYDTYRNMLKTVQLSQTGNSALNITPDNLSNGIYSYSLIVNGTVIDTKKMLLQK